MSEASNSHTDRCHSCHNRPTVPQVLLDQTGIADSQSYKTCAKCGTQFLAAEHVEPKRTSSKRFQCDICNRFYATPITLKAHRIRHSKAKNELCDFCGASFKTRGQLKIHRRAHTGEKPYQCDQCDKAFAYRESLITHSTLHSRIKPFVCSCCDARFSCITNLLKHRKVRGNKCGLVDGAPIQRVVPRPNKKTMPNLTDRSKVPKQTHTKQINNVPISIAAPVSESKIDESKDFSKAFKISAERHDSNDFFVETLNAEESVHDSTIVQSLDKCGDANVLAVVGKISILEDARIEEFDVSDMIGDEDQHDYVTIIDETDVQSSVDDCFPEDNALKVVACAKQADDSNSYIYMITFDNEFDAVSNNAIEYDAQNEDDMEFESTFTPPCDHSGDQSDDCEVSNTGITQDSERMKTGSTKDSTTNINKPMHVVSVSEDISKKHISIDTSACLSKTNINLKKASQHTKRIRSQMSKNVELPLEDSWEAQDEESIKRDEETLQKQLTVLRESSEALASCYQCKLCPQRYTSEYLMARHLDRIHNLQQDKVCEKLQYAKKIVKGTAKYRCKYCDQSYVTAARLKQHVPKHGPNGRLRFKCCCCVMYFETSELAHEHALAEHRERLVCDVCQKQFNKPETLQRHSRYVHNSEQKARKRQYICSRCGRKLPTTAALFDHERADCGSSPLYPCNTCGKRYASFSSLKIHQTVHENRLPFECGYCEKKFRTKGQLKVHERAHTGEKPFRCEVCSKAFPYRESLLTHRTTHTGIMRYECLDCNQKFSCITNLQSHRRTRHNEGERKRSKISKRNHNKFE